MEIELVQKRDNVVVSLDIVWGGCHSWPVDHMLWIEVTKDLPGTGEDGLYDG